MLQSLFTRGELDEFGACLTLNVAAPLKLALATLLNLDTLSCVASAAAHLSAAIGTVGVLVAFSALGAKGASGFVLSAVVRRLL